MSFLQTEIIDPHLSHVDYPWNYLKSELNLSRRTDFIKPVIATFPLTDEGMMINVWLNNDQSKGKV